VDDQPISASSPRRSDGCVLSANVSALFLPQVLALVYVARL
jgi:hypothetical protein